MTDMKIAGIGDNVIDRYMNMGVMFPGGNAVNVAAHASRLGAVAAYVGSIGADREGRIIRDALTVSPNASHIGCLGPQPACVGSHIHRVPAWIHDAHVHIPVYYIITYTSYLHVCLPTPVSSNQYSSFL